MHTIFYFWMTIAGLTGMWALWTFGFRPLILDRFRFEIKGLLLELDEIVATGCLSTHSPAYQMEKATLEGLIRIAPKFGLLQLFASHLHVQKNARDSEADPSAVFEASIVGLQPFAQDRLRSIRNRLAILSLRFVLLRAPLWAAFGYFTYFIDYLRGRIRRSVAPVDVLQREAYISGQHSHHDEALA